jgi:hypothetical protein
MLGAGVFIMERHFFIEVKTFCLSAKDGYPDFRLEEKRKGFVGVYFCESTNIFLVGGYDGGGHLC